LFSSIIATENIQKVFKTTILEPYTHISSANNKHFTTTDTTVHPVFVEEFKMNCE